MSGGISKANESSTSVEWINKGFKKTNMGTPESTAQVHPRLLTRALLERAVASGKTKFLRGKNESVLQAALKLWVIYYLCASFTGTVKGVTLNGSKVCGVKIDDYELPADAILIALGPWSGHARSWFPKANLPETYGMRAHSVVVRLPQAPPPQALFLPNDRGEVNSICFIRLNAAEMAM